MIDLDTLRKAKGYVLAIVDESTGEYKPVSDDIMKVIKCKDCEYYANSSEECWLINTRLHFYVADKKWTENSFCSWAERKQDEID